MKSVRPCVPQYFCPPLDFAAELFQPAAIGEEVVVQEEDEFLRDRLHSVDHYARAQEPRLALVELPDGAEVAIEAAPARRHDGCHRTGNGEEVLVLVTGDEVSARRRELVERALLIAFRSEGQ
jgi:hypothetical protein